MSDGANGTFDFTGKRVLVTGASHGIGLAIAEAFCRAGAHLTILSSTPDITEAAKGIEARTGRTVRGVICDITDREAVRRSVGALPGLDVLINNAGLELITPMLEPGEEVEQTFERVIKINVVGTYYVTREALRLMGPGSSIVVTSGLGKVRRGRLRHLRHLEARQHRLHACAHEGTGAAGHSGQRGVPRLGAHARGPAFVA